MEVVEDIQYMGVTIGRRCRRIFQKEKEKWTKKGLKQAVVLYKKVASSYDKVTVGKAL